MSRRNFALVLAALLAVCGQAAAAPFDRLSFRLTPGAFMPVGGRFSDVTRLRKTVDLGAGLTGGLRYRVSDYFYLGADYGLTWMRAKAEYRPFESKETGPALNVMMLTVNSTFILSTGFGINPYFTLGGGLYPWRFSRRPLWGAPWAAPADPTQTFAMTSLGLNTGIGVQKNISSRLAIFVEVMYHYVFSRNPERFGTDDFNEQDFLGLNLGLSFGFGKR